MTVGGKQEENILSTYICQCVSAPTTKVQFRVVTVKCEKSGVAVV